MKDERESANSGFTTMNIRKRMKQVSTDKEAQPSVCFVVAAMSDDRGTFHVMGRPL